jgi:hypothetical protein
MQPQHHTLFLKDQNWSGRGAKENKFMPLPGIETWSSNPQRTHCTD